jgi:hypothetical protein
MIERSQRIAGAHRLLVLVDPASEDRDEKLPWL